MIRSRVPSKRVLRDSCSETRLSSQPSRSLAGSMDIHRFLRLRPYCFHYTAASNEASLRARSAIHSASYWLHAAGHGQRCRERRRQSEPVQGPGFSISLRDQAPLHEANILFEGGYAFADVLTLLNRHCFFWPGSADSPIAPGRKFRNRYRSERLSVVRVETAALVDANRDRLRLCQYNTGAPRWTNGRASPRGPRTLVKLSEFNLTPGAVVEVAFEDVAFLPERAWTIAPAT